ncbi:MAG: hypothetical protein K0Q68_2011 [Moraxellaceae bacterium]|jgi:Rieske Fe-S protein|nr:hypothetical protein [Moraxellaceae bacterium]
MIKKLSVGLLVLLAGGVAVAAPAATTAKKPATAAPETASEAPASAARIDVIGSQEAPTVFNVVPWKDKPSRLPKKEVTTSILRETLQPLDPEILRREIELQRRLGEQ